MLQNTYKLALGYYNVTYYGYAWNLVEYFRSGADGYYIPEHRQPSTKNITVLLLPSNILKSDGSGF